MFFETTDDKLPKGMFKACIVPRPIAWISSISKDGITNLAPFSYFQAVCDSPPMIMFVSSPKMDSGDVKDTATNIEQTKEFVVNLVNMESKEDMSLSSSNLPYGESEIEKYNIKTRKSHLVIPPSVENSPVNLECKYEQTIGIKNNKMIIGKVVGIYVKNEFFQDGKIITKNLQVISRLGYSYYSEINNIFSMPRK